MGVFSGVAFEQRRTCWLWEGTGITFFLCIRFLYRIILYQKESKEKRMELLVVCITCDEIRMT